MTTQQAEVVGSRDTAPDHYFIRAGNCPNPMRRREVRSTEYWTHQRIQRSGRFQYQVYRKAWQLAHATKARTIVDVGCGVGTKLSKFFGRVFHTIGIDTPESIEICRRRYPNGNWISDDFENPAIHERGVLPEPDVIICADVIEHLERPERLMAYLESLASRECLLVISTPDRERNDGADVIRPTNKEHVREWSSAEFDAFFQQSGWRILEHKFLLPFQLKLDRMSVSYLRGRVRSGLPLKTTQMIVGRLGQ